MDPTQAAAFESRLDSMSSDMSDIRTSLAQLAQAYTRLAVLEERQTHGKEALERAFREIESLQGRLRSLEAAAPVNAQTTTWVNKVIGLVIAAVVGGAITAGLARHAPRAEQPPPYIEGKR